MTKKKIIEISTEEQALLAAEQPILLQAIEENKPIAKAWLAHWRAKREVDETAKKQAEEIQQEIIKNLAPEQASLFQWCGYPTDMTRCSPFFPLNSNQLGERKFLQDYVITSANWGEICYTGPQLSTYDEDVLFALLAILEKQTQYRKNALVVENVEEKTLVVYDENQITLSQKKLARKSYTYKGAMLPLLKILGNEKPGKRNYKRALRALERLAVAGVKISVSTGKTKSGKRRAPRISQMSAMLAGVLWDDKKKELTATINPFFYETYGMGRITSINVEKRMSLKGVIARAMYRFIAGHVRGFEGHFLTLADALNMDREQPPKEIRRLLKTAINELVKHGILDKKSGFYKKESHADIVKLVKSANH